MRGLGRIREALEALSIAFFPPRCGACGEPLAVRPRFGLCDICFELLEPNLGPRCPHCDLPNTDGACAMCRADPPPFARLRAPYVYGGAIADLVVAAKFRGREDFAAALAGLMLEDEELIDLAEGATALVPVPLGRRRARQRGYNQAAILARTLGRTLHLPVHHLLRRTRDTKPQSDLPLAARHANVHGAFSGRSTSRLTRNVTPPLPAPTNPMAVAETGTRTGKVALVDDVVTSATTVREAAVALLAAGATKVVVLAAARASLPETSRR